MLRRCKNATAYRPCALGSPSSAAFTIRRSFGLRY
jgi:hypothetical protein